MCKLDFVKCICTTRNQPKHNFQIQNPLFSLNLGPIPLPGLTLSAPGLVLNCLCNNLHNSWRTSWNHHLTDHTFHKLFPQYLFSISINLVIGHNHYYYIHFLRTRNSLWKVFCIIYGREYFHFLTHFRDLSCESVHVFVFLDSKWK